MYQTSRHILRFQRKLSVMLDLIFKTADRPYRRATRYNRVRNDCLKNEDPREDGHS